MSREVKRRSDVIGIFLIDEAIIRLVGALMLETNDEWASPDYKCRLKLPLA